MNVLPAKWKILIDKILKINTTGQEPFSNPYETGIKSQEVKLDRLLAKFIEDSDDHEEVCVGKLTYFLEQFYEKKIQTGNADAPFIRAGDLATIVGVCSVRNRKNLLRWIGKSLVINGRTPQEAMRETAKRVEMLRQNGFDEKDFETMGN
jgi:hypothetical protein